MKEITAGYVPPASEETGIRYPCAPTSLEFEYAKFGTPEYVDVLRKRIAEVRNWVQNLDYEHRISFLVPDP